MGGGREGEREGGREEGREERWEGRTRWLLGVVFTGLGFNVSHFS